MLSPLLVEPILRWKCLDAQCIPDTTGVCLKALEKHFFLLAPVNKRQQAKDTTSTTNQAGALVNKRQETKDTAHTPRKACTPVKKRQDAKDTAHTAHQACTPSDKRQEAHVKAHATIKMHTAVN